MSHTARQTCTIKGVSKAKVKEALKLLVDSHGGQIVENTATVNLYGGRTANARGTVVRGLDFAAYGTDIDVVVNEKGEMLITGDATSIKRVQREVEKCYEAVSRREALQRQGMKTKLVHDPRKRLYILEGVA